MCVALRPVFIPSQRVYSLSKGNISGTILISDFFCCSVCHANIVCVSWWLVRCHVCVSPTAIGQSLTGAYEEGVCVAMATTHSYSPLLLMWHSVTGGCSNGLMHFSQFTYCAFVCLFLKSEMNSPWPSSRFWRLSDSLTLFVSLFLFLSCPSGQSASLSPR